jgi:peptide methionine sulfoxide reductase MsrB
MKREKVLITAWVVELNFLTLLQNMKVDLVGPSFYKSLPEVFVEKKDMHIGYPRTEYHCKKCGGHHGHVFEDGPKPTGKRYCNNGVCLVFKPKSE